MRRKSKDLPEPSYRNRFPYRARDGMFFGVCKGLANYAVLSVFWIRAIAVVTGFMFFPAVPVIYVILAIVMKPEPIVELETSEDEEFYASYASNRKMALSRLAKRFESLDRRARRLEAAVTDRESEWDRRLRSGV